MYQNKQQQQQQPQQQRSGRKVPNGYQQNSNNHQDIEQNDKQELPSKLFQELLKERRNVNKIGNDNNNAEEKMASGLSLSSSSSISDSIQTLKHQIQQLSDTVENQRQQIKQLQDHATLVRKDDDHMETCMETLREEQSQIKEAMKQLQDHAKLVGK